MTNREKDVLELFNELKSMFTELQNDCNKLLAENTDLKKDVDWYKKYTDALIEHKDMVCLPADLKNLRESNATLATENEELKKKVETLNGIIAQAWFTDVEEKNKQIDYLLKKVEELTKPEPTEEEVTKTFMDAQTNPKDIESDLKYFCASNGKWYNAELIKQDIEFDAEKLVASVEEAASKLKSIKEHNNRFTKEIACSTGIACPKCGSELMYVDQNLLLTSPPQRRVQCSKCNHIDYILV